MVIALRSPDPEKPAWLYQQATSSRPARRRRWILNLAIGGLLFFCLSRHWSGQEAALERAAGKLAQQLHSFHQQNNEQQSDVASAAAAAAVAAIGGAPLQRRNAVDLHHNLDKDMPKTTVLGHTPGCTVRIARTGWSHITQGNYHRSMLTLD